MDNIKSIIKTIWLSLGGVAGAVVGVLYGEWTHLLTIYAIMVLLDILTGYLAARHDGNVDSKRFLHGIYKKIGTWIVIALCRQVDLLLPEFGLNLMSTSVFIFIFNEVLSVLENAGKLGIETEYLSSIFVQVRDAKEKELKSKVDQEGDEDETNLPRE